MSDAYSGGKADSDDDGGMDVDYVQAVYESLFNTKPSKPPFGTMRYQMGGTGTGAVVQQNDKTGMIIKAASGHDFDLGDPDRDDSGMNAEQQVSNSTYGAQASMAQTGAGGLTSTSTRDRTQNVIQGDLSATERQLSATQVARALGSEGTVKALQGDSGLWEWLHLVAFSIGPQFTATLSQASQTWLQSSAQTAQISENLILGTKEANSAMLTFETALKAFLKLDAGITLTLAVGARVQMVPVKAFDAEVPVARLLKFDYIFTRGTGAVTPPSSIEFDLFGHAMPSFAEFEAMYKEAAKNAASWQDVSTLPDKAGTGMKAL